MKKIFLTTLILTITVAVAACLAACKGKDVDNTDAPLPYLYTITSDTNPEEIVSDQIDEEYFDAFIDWLGGDSTDLESLVGDLDDIKSTTIKMGVSSNNKITVIAVFENEERDGKTYDHIKVETANASLAEDTYVIEEEIGNDTYETTCRLEGGKYSYETSKKPKTSSDEPLFDEEYIQKILKTSFAEFEYSEETHAYEYRKATWDYGFLTTSHIQLRFVQGIPCYVCYELNNGLVFAGAKSDNILRFEIMLYDFNNTKVVLPTELEELLSKRSMDEIGLLYDLTDNTYHITNYLGTEKNVIIPMTYRGIPVTMIEKKAFYDNSIIESVTIPDSVAVAENTFSYCNNLKTITAGLTNVSAVLKQSYHDLDVIIPEGTSEIEQEAFYGLSHLRNISLPDSITKIGSNAFYYCSVLESFSIPPKVTYIDEYTFYGCIKMKTIDIHDNVTAIKKQAFRLCLSLESITIPTSVTFIGDNAFGYCTALKDIYYQGTRAQWRKITKENGWDAGIVDYTVHCTDDEE